jgi:hypothetical protein
MPRITKPTIGCFKYDLVDHKHEVGEFAAYEAFFNYNMAVKRLGELEDAITARPAEEWHEDYGDCLWWIFPIEEPPYCGSPLELNFPQNFTHFTRLIMPIE